MSVAGVLRIRAIDAADNQPIEEFNVKIGFCETRRPDDPSPRGISSSLINPGVNIQGTKKEYRLDGQAVGTPYKVIVAAKGYETQMLPRVEAQRADTAPRVDVPLKRIRPEDYQTVAGRLLHADGTPIAGAQVRLLLGSEVPQRIDPFTQQQRRDGWRFYHWDLLSRDDIENRDKCVQLLKTASDSDGNFRFDGVKKGTPWMELFYFGKGLMSQRYNNLRSRDENELTQLKFTAQQPSRLIVRVRPRQVSGSPQRDARRGRLHARAERRETRLRQPEGEPRKPQSADNLFAPSVGRLCGPNQQETHPLGQWGIHGHEPCLPESPCAGRRTVGDRI